MKLAIRFAKIWSHSTTSRFWTLEHLRQKFIQLQTTLPHQDRTTKWTCIQFHVVCKYPTQLNRRMEGERWRISRVRSSSLASKFKGFRKMSNFKIKCAITIKRRAICIQIQGIASKTHALSNHEGLCYHAVLMCLKHRGRSVTLRWNVQYLEETTEGKKKKSKQAISIILEYICSSVFTCKVLLAPLLSSWTSPSPLPSWSLHESPEAQYLTSQI